MEHPHFHRHVSLPADKWRLRTDFTKYLSSCCSLFGEHPAKISSVLLPKWQHAGSKTRLGICRSYLLSYAYRSYRIIRISCGSSKNQFLPVVTGKGKNPQVIPALGCLKRGDLYIAISIQDVILKLVCVWFVWAVFSILLWIYSMHIIASWVESNIVFTASTSNKHILVSECQSQVKETITVRSCFFQAILGTNPICNIAYTLHINLTWLGRQIENTKTWICLRYFCLCTMVNNHQTNIWDTIFSFSRHPTCKSKQIMRDVASRHPSNMIFQRFFLRSPGE